MALADYLDECTRKTPFIHFNRQILKELQIRPLPRKLKAGKEPARNSLYLVSSGMMVENTPSYLVASGLLGHERNGVGFVGYCDPDTPGGKLLQAKTGDNFVFEATHTMVKLKARVERFALSGHAEREELLAFAVQTEAKTIVLTHGDPPARRWFKQKLAEARPQTNVIDPVPLQTYPL
jgi:Cft2 family RNA processing exonuclease